jgi:hypothetical protein
MLKLSFYRRQLGAQGLAEGYDITAISDHSNLDTGTQCGCAAAATHLAVSDHERL